MVPGGPSRERSPAEIRQAMSALQRGWQKGRETDFADEADQADQADRADEGREGNTDGT